MSIVKDKDGNVLNPVSEIMTRYHKYSGEQQDTIDWFDLHPEDRPSLPSAADLDVTVSEQEAADATAPSGDDLSQVQLSDRPGYSGLVEPAEPAVSESASESERPASDVPEVPPSGDGL